MVPSTQRRFRIVAALDGSEYAEIVLEHAIDQAARHDRVDLHFVTVVDAIRKIAETRANLGATVLQGLEVLGTKATDWRSWTHVLVGKAEDELATFCGDIRADLLVIGRFGIHHARRSTADRVITLAPCATLVVNLGQDVLEPLCPLCAAIREDTNAERLFCSEHSTEGPLHVTSLVTRASSYRGGSVW